MSQTPQRQPGGYRAVPAQLDLVAKVGEQNYLSMKIDG